MLRKGGGPQPWAARDGGGQMRKSNGFPQTVAQARRQNNHKGLSRSQGNSPQRHNDPFYQPPPKIPQMDHGKRVTFFRNGDATHRGLPMAVNRTFATMGSLLHHLTRELGLNCQRVFQWPQGFELMTIGDFEHQTNYVVSDQHQLDRSINYGNLMHPVSSPLKVNHSRVGGKKIKKKKKSFSKF